MRPIERKERGIFARTKRVNRLADVLAELSKLGVGPGLELRSSAAGPKIALAERKDQAWAAITGSTLSGDRYTYSWQEVEFTGSGYTGWTTKSGGQTGTNNAYNLAEVPTKTYRFRPVPDDTVVRLHRLRGTAENWWFNGDENQDTNVLVAAPDTLKVLDGTSDPWSLVDDKGKGVRFTVYRSAYVEPDKTLYQYGRVLTFDDSGRLISVSAEEESVVFTGVESCA